MEEEKSIRDPSCLSAPENFVMNASALHSGSNDITSEEGNDSDESTKEAVSETDSCGSASSGSLCEQEQCITPCEPIASEFGPTPDANGVGSVLASEDNENESEFLTQCGAQDQSSPAAQSSEPNQCYDDKVDASTLHADQTRSTTDDKAYDTSDEDTVKTNTSNEDTVETEELGGLEAVTSLLRHNNELLEKNMEQNSKLMLMISKSATGGSNHDKNDKSDYTELRGGRYFLAKTPIKRGSQVFKGFQEIRSKRRPIIGKKLRTQGPEVQNEIDILVKLEQHNNIVRIFDSVDTNDGLSKCLILEECNENTLEDVVNSKASSFKPFDLQSMRKYSRHLLEGMSFIHENHIIHGDLKPENILFSRDMRYLKIGDFGLSIELKNGISRASNRKTGTDGWRAPETYEDDKIDKKSDVFSMALVLYFIWTRGKHPFGKTHEWMRNIVESKDCKLYDLSQLPNDEPRKSELCKLLEDMICYNPQCRPTVEEIASQSFFSEDLSEKKLDEVCEEALDESKSTPISKAVYIELKETKIDLLGCKVNITDEATEETTIAYVGVRATSDNVPKDQFAVSPEVECEIFKSDIHNHQVALSLPLCARPGDQKLQVFAKRVGEGWKNLGEPSRVNRAVEFIVSRFKSIKVLVTCSQLPEDESQEPTKSEKDLLVVRMSTKMFYNENSTKKGNYHVQVSRPKGTVLIINNEFTRMGASKQKPRDGSKKDMIKQVALWKDLGFDVVPKINLSAKDMEIACQNFVANAREKRFSIVVVAIMTHGCSKEGKQFFFGEDGNTISLDKVISVFNKFKSSMNQEQIDEWKETPKVFMFQACRNGTDASTAECGFPAVRNMLIAYPCQLGKKASISKSGSRVMNAVAEIFKQHAHDTHVLDMFTKVNDLVSESGGGKFKVVPSERTLLTKNLYLFPGWPTKD